LRLKQRDITLSLMYLSQPFLTRSFLVCCAHSRAMVDPSNPLFVHGDLWYANSGIDVDIDESLIFDECCFYAHNECKSYNHQRPVDFRWADVCVFNEDEFGQWRPVCNRFGTEYLASYHSYVQISPPEEDYDGHLDLYKL
jgi:protein-ribulosamine 3-kinase